MSIDTFSTVQDCRDTLSAEASSRGLSAEGLSVLNRIMNAESQGKVNATAEGRSSAKGLFQFLDDTWAGLVSLHPNELTKDGRSDPKQQCIAAIYFTQDNENALTRALGRKPDAGELYLAHFLGAGGGIKKGATDVIKEAQAHPDTPIKGFLPQNVLDANGYKDARHKGVRLPLTDGSELLFSGFTVADTVNWANGKMKEPAKYDTANFKRYKKNGMIPDSLGDMSFVAILVAVVGLVVAAVNGAFSDDLPSPRTPGGHGRHTSRA